MRCIGVDIDSCTHLAIRPHEVIEDASARRYRSTAHAANTVLAYPFIAGSAMGLRHADSVSGYRAVLDAQLERAVPSEHRTDRFVLEPLRTSHLHIDLEAVRGSAAALRSVFAPSDSWPH